MMEIDKEEFPGFPATAPQLSMEQDTDGSVLPYDL